MEWGAASRPLPGQEVSGDHCVVQSFPAGVLVAVMDGLGHGEEAARAAERAGTVLAADPRGPLPGLVQRCHEALRGTRGAVMSLASLDLTSQAMTWLGVGNVEGVLLRSPLGLPAGLRARESLISRGGVVGDRLPPLRPVTLPLRPGDTLIFSTDGILPGFLDPVDLYDPPQMIAGQVLAGFARPTDDALVLVARYLGQGP